MRFYQEYIIDREMPCLISQPEDDRRYTLFTISSQIAVVTNKFTDAFDSIVEMKFIEITKLAFYIGNANNSIAPITSMNLIL